MPYKELREALAQVKLAEQAPWQHLNRQDFAALNNMYGYNVAQAHNGNQVDDGFQGDRQANQEGGRFLFFLSQSAKNPYRYTRLAAYNGSWVPVIALGTLKLGLCATLDQLIALIKANSLRKPSGWPQGLSNLWRTAPHGNWAGDLPERRLSNGEEQWFLSRRAQQAYAMNEWQIHHNQQRIYPFDAELANDPGAIRIVSVTARRSLDGHHWSYAPPEDEEQPERRKLGAEGMPRHLYRPGGQDYEGDVKGKMGIRKPPEGRKPKDTDYRMRLYTRRPIRFYFSFNHYRTIEAGTSQGTIVINPWFAIAED